MAWVVIHQMSILHQSIVMLMVLFLLWMIFRVIPQWGVPQSDEPGATIDSLKWMLTTVGLTWITLFIYNHFHGWYRLVNWGSSSWCPTRRSSSPEPSLPVGAFRSEEMNTFMEYVRTMENRILELEGRTAPPPPRSPWSEESRSEMNRRSRSSMSADDGSDSSTHGGLRPEARRIDRTVPPPPPHPPNQGPPPPEPRNPPNAQPDRRDLSGARRRVTPSSSTSSSSNASNRGCYYAVRGGPSPGIYGTWSEASQATIGHPMTLCQRFVNIDDAWGFVEGDPIRFGRRMHI